MVLQSVIVPEPDIEAAAAGIGFVLVGDSRWALAGIAV